MPAVAAPYGTLPLSFERNRGQSAAEVEYLSRGRNYTLFLTGTEAVLSLRQPAQRKSAVLRMRMVGANTGPVMAGEELLQGKINYLLGNDRSRWRTGVPTYRRVRYSDVWKGIDVVWHGTQNALEYDFIVSPGVDPSQIRMRLEGASRLRLDRNGNLIAKTPAGDVIQHAPVLYQGHTRVQGEYVLRGRREIGFKVGAYDASQPLIIDPVVVYSTYLGGSLADDAFGIAVDAQGQAFVTGVTESGPNDFPQRGGLETSGGDFFLFVTKLNAGGTDLIYSTLIGTNNAVSARGIAVTSEGKACITGATENVSNDSDYPVTENAYQGNGACCGRRNSDAIVTMLNAEGDKILYSTFYGGSALFSNEKAEDAGEAVAVDARGLIYITGTTSSNDLDTPNGFQRSRKSSSDGTDVFVAVFDPNQSKGDDTLRYASYLGGRDDDEGFGIATDDVGNAYVGGRTRSTDLETKSPAGQSLPPLQAFFQGDAFDGFVAKIDTEAKGDSSLTYLTYFGGNGNDRVESIAVDAFQRAYITGATRSAATAFPLLNAFDLVQFNGEAFVAKLNADGTALFYCSFLGGENGNVSGTDFEEGMGIAVDSAGNAYVTGNTTSRNTFPAGESEAGGLPPEQRGTAFVAKVEASDSATFLPQLIYSTTFGGDGTKAAGIAVDASDAAYIAGSSTGALPTTPEAFQTKFGGVRDAFVAKVESTPADTTGLYDFVSNQFLLRNKNTTGGPDLTVVFGQAGDLPVVGDWDADSITDAGVFRPSTGQFLLQQGTQTLTINFVGAEGDLPMAGDWDGDGFDTIGLFRTDPKLGTSFFLTNSRAVDGDFPNVDIQFVAGQPGDLPLGGDWDGDGLDTVGLFQPSTTTFFLFNAFVADAIAFQFGLPGVLPLAGDWNGDEIDGVGVYLPSTLNMHLTNDFGLSEFIFQFQARAGEFPLGGDWDGE